MTQPPRSVDAARKRKMELEVEIALMLSTFAQETGLVVTGLRVDKAGISYQQEDGRIARLGTLLDVTITAELI